MPITELYSDYFQKSKTFLLPMLGVQRCKHTAGLMTFIAWPNKFQPNDCRLMVCSQIKEDDDEEFRRFTLMYFLSNKYYDGSVKIGNTTIYAFNLLPVYKDWDYFLNGQYSKLSMDLKQKICGYYGEKSPEWQQIQGFLYPEIYFETYAKLLYDEKEYAQGLTYLKNVGELCSPYDLELETLRVRDFNLAVST